MSDHYRRAMHSRRNGFGMNLYRNIRKKKIGGVCAGIADHFEVDHTIMRIVFIGGFFLTGAAMFWLYVIAWIVMVPKPRGKKVDHHEDESVYEYDECERRYRKKNMFRYRASAGERVRRARQRVQDIVGRVDAMEHYVTSKRYDLQKQFADLEK